MPVRTFLALDLDAAILDRLEQAQRRIGESGDRIRWVDVKNLHVTLNFLGDVPDDTIHDVCSIAAEVASRVEPFEFDVRGVQCVPPKGPLRMIWGGVHDATGRMAWLHDELAAALSGMGLKEEERSFKPHITLARVKFAAEPDAVRRVAAKLAQEDFGVQHAEELVAYSSILTDEGPIYTPLTRAPLGE